MSVRQVEDGDGDGDGDEALNELTEDAGLRARLKQLVMDHRSRQEWREVASLVELERRVDSMLVATEDKVVVGKREGQEEGADGDGDDDDDELERGGDDADDSQPARAKSAAVTTTSLPDKIRSSMSQISSIFSGIFQTLLVLMESGSVGGPETFTPEEKAKATKRSKDFNVRLSRMAFELKQKVVRCTSTAPIKVLFK